MQAIDAEGNDLKVYDLKLGQWVESHSHWLDLFQKIFTVKSSTWVEHVDTVLILRIWLNQSSKPEVN